nr:immunoglobulin heavy chain junction region [Mus musculus]
CVGFDGYYDWYFDVW